MDLLDQADQVAIELTLAIKGGDVPALERLLAARPGLATAGIIGRKGPEGGVRTPLHVVTDWTACGPRRRLASCPASRNSSPRESRRTS